MNMDKGSDLHDNGLISHNFKGNKADDVQSVDQNLASKEPLEALDYSYNEKFSQDHHG